MTNDLAIDEDFFLVPFFHFSFFPPINEDVKNSTVSSDPCCSDYESDDESNYSSSNSEIYIKDFSIILRYIVSCKVC